MSDVTIDVTDNGPYIVRGEITVKDADGKSHELKGRAVALCRCGHSSTKPFCDGTHRKVDFQSAPRAGA